jgi:SAM-dependent methyltransferase
MFRQPERTSDGGRPRMRIEWHELRAMFRSVAVAGVERWIAPHAQHCECNRQFAEARLDEGVELSAYFATKYPGRNLRILDVGAGNGGVALALANAADHFVVALDVVYNADLAYLRRQTRLKLYQVISSSERLPFLPNSFDGVLCLVTFEHLSNTSTSGKEMMRVTKPGGQVMLTTPARIRYLWKPDPHYQIRGLLLLPDPLQRYVVERRLGPAAHYDVTHTFWTAGGIIRKFPKRGRVDVLVEIPWPGHPRNLREFLWKAFRRFLWDRIVIWKR